MEERGDQADMDSDGASKIAVTVLEKFWSDPLRVSCLALIRLLVERSEGS